MKQQYPSCKYSDEAIKSTAAMVVMDRAEYEEKIETMLVDGTYRKLRTDPKTKVERKIDAALKQAEGRGDIQREK